MRNWRDWWKAYGVDLWAGGFGILMLVAFLFLPWFNVGGASFTGWALLTQDSAHDDSVGLVIIPVAAVAAIVLALWEVLGPRSRLPALLMAAAGVVGAGYHFLYVAQHSAAIIGDRSRLGIGFWLSLLAAMALIVQLLFTRPGIPALRTLVSWAIGAALGVFGAFLAAGVVGPAIVVAVINASIRGTVPITLGSLSGIFSERSSIVNIGIEGMMLMSAYAGFMINVFLSGGSVPPALQAEPVRLGLSIIGGVLVGGLLGLMHATLSVRFTVDQIISGTVINILAIGLTGFLYVPGATTLGRLPPVIANPFRQSDELLFWLGEIAFNKGVITYLMVALVFMVTLALFRTAWGLRTRAIGEHPRAADTLGINVHRMQYLNLFFSGCMAGLGGVFLTLEAVGTFERGMTNGRGFIALAVMIFGKWHPLGAAAGALLFGFATALQGQLQFFNINIPHQFVGMLPYLLTVIVLAGFVGRARPPAHVGKPYEVE